MRLFVALVPPDEVLDDLDRAVTELRREAGDAVPSPAGHVRLRWTAREQWHLTLVFLGEVDEALRPGLDRRLGRAASRHDRLRLCLRDGGRFGRPTAARVLWTGVGGDVEPLRGLAGSVHAAARRSGVEVGEARFGAHITLARLREPGDVRPLVERLGGYAGPEFVAERIELIRSYPVRGAGRRPRYESVGSWPLGRGSNGPG